MKRPCLFFAIFLFCFSAISNSIILHINFIYLQGGDFVKLLLVAHFFLSKCKFISDPCLGVSFNYKCLKIFYKDKL